MSNWQLAMPNAQAYWLGKVLFEMHHDPEKLALYKKTPQEFLERYELTPAMRERIMTNDVAGLYLSGVNPYILRAHCIGMGIPEAVSLAALRSVLAKPVQEPA